MDSWPPKTSQAARRRCIDAARAAKAVTNKRYGRSHAASHSGSIRPNAPHTSNNSKQLWDNADDLGHDDTTNYGSCGSSNRTHQPMMQAPAAVPRQTVEAHHHAGPQPRMANYGSVALGVTDPAGPLYGASNVDIHMASSKDTVDTVEVTATSASNGAAAVSTSSKATTRKKGKGRRFSEDRSPPPSPPNYPATIAKWTLIASAAALWGYLCHLYYNCGEKTCCKEMQKFVTALQKTPDIPRMVLTFTFFAGTLLMLMTILEALFGLYSYSVGDGKKEAGLKPAKRSPRTSEAADEQPGYGTVRRAQTAGSSSQ